MKNRLIIFGVLVISLVNAFWMLSRISLSEHECFVSVTAREMLESGDWVLPTCNGESRLQKTPLSYWLVAGFAGITGRVDEFAARLPSAVFAVLSAAAILYFVSRLLSLRIAAFSAAVWATSLGYICYSHSARPEMPLTFFITLCFLSFYAAVTAEDRKKQVLYMLLFWVSFGLANLAKGPAPLPLVLLPLFIYTAAFKKWRILPKLLPVAGTIIFLAIVLPWPLAIAHRVNWDLVIWKKEFFDRFFGNYDPGHKPIYYYLYDMFIYIVPWVVLLPMALAAPFYRVWGKKRPLIQFCWIWFVVSLLFLTASGGKRQHYILPLMPAMAILIGIILDDMIFEQKAYSPDFARKALYGHIIAIIIAATGVTIFAAGFEPQLLTRTIIISTMTIALISVITMQFVVRRTAAACITVFLGVTAWFTVACGFFERPWDSNLYLKDFAKNVAAIVSSNDDVIAYNDISKRFVHYFGKVVPVVTSKRVLLDRYEQGGWIIAESNWLEELSRDEQFRMECRCNAADQQKNPHDKVGLFHKP